MSQHNAINKSIDPRKSLADGVYHLPLGRSSLTAYRDGTVHWTMNRFMNDPNLVTAMLENRGEASSVDLSINAYLLVQNDTIVLIDAGFGKSSTPENGRLLTLLGLANIQPEAVTAILLTHLHLDHADGVSQDGTPMFPKATVYVAEKEIDYWFDPKNAEYAPADKKHAFAEAHAIDPYLRMNKVVKIIEDGPLLPGISAIHAPGHTPGHTAFLITTSEQTVLHWGDVIHLEQLQFEKPELFSSFDTNPADAIATRRRLMSMAAENVWLVASSHITFPGLGHVQADQNESYIWQPLATNSNDTNLRYRRLTLPNLDDSAGRLPLMDPETLDPAQKQLYDRIDHNLIPWAAKAGFRGKTSDGYFVGPYNSFLYSPQLTSGFLDFMHAETTHTTLSKTVREVVILTIGAVWHSNYELYAHTALGRQAGLSKEIIEALARGDTPQALSPPELTAHRFTKQLAREHKVEEATYGAAETIFGRQGLVDMTFLIGLYLYTCAALNAFDIPVPA